MCSRPVVSLAIASLNVLGNTICISFHKRLLACKQSVADVQQARRIFSHRLDCPVLSVPRTAHKQLVADVHQARRFFNSCLPWYMLKIFVTKF